MHGITQTHGALTGALDSICPKPHQGLCLGGSVTLTRGRVHEVLGNSADMFALCVAASMRGMIFWCGLGRDLASLAPSGIQEFFDPKQLVLNEGVTRCDVLFAAEQALRCEGVNCVIIELERGPDLKESRRLQLAAEESGALGLILISGRAQTSAAETRWLCRAISEPEYCWQWECIKHRKGNTGVWRVKWLGGEHGPDLISMAAATAA